MSLSSYLAKLNDRRTCPRIDISKLKKIILIIVLVIGSVLTLKAVQAQTATAQENVLKDQKSADEAGGNLTPYLGEALKANTYQGLKGLVGVIPNDVLDGKIDYKRGAYIPGGVMGIANNMIASLYTPAGGTSGIQYIAQSFKSFAGQPAYAQGVGFAGLQPIQKIWTGFRNVTYLLSSIVFIVIGIMIMLRVKVSPQAVVTIQNAIPQLITTLVLITFSYAIAGLLIDLMQFLQSSVIAILFNMQGVGFGSTLFKNIFGGSLFSNYDFKTLSSANMDTIAGLTQRAIPMSPFIVWGMVLGGIIGSLAGLGVGSVPGAVVGAGLAIPVLLLVLAILMLIWMFKFYFGCLKCYVTVIFKIVIAPLEIAAGAFPNSKMGFNTWIWDLIANLSVFPISVIFLVLGNIIIEATYTSSQMWVPAILAGDSLQKGIVNLATLTQLVSVGIGLSVVALMSKLPEMIPQFIFMIKPSPWSLAVGEGLNPKWLQNGVGLAKATAQQGIHDELIAQEKIGTPLGTRLGTLGRGMEVVGLAKEKR